MVSLLAVAAAGADAAAAAGLVCAVSGLASGAGGGAVAQPAMNKVVRITGVARDNGRRRRLFMSNFSVIIVELSLGPATPWSLHKVRTCTGAVKQTSRECPL